MSTDFCAQCNGWSDDCNCEDENQVCHLCGDTDCAICDDCEESCCHCDCDGIR